LIVFFGLRAATRIYSAFAEERAETLALAIDVLLIAALILLIVGIERTGRGLVLAENEAQYREQEYRRALVDYRRLARHRLANPLSVIRGGLIALKTLDLSDEERRKLLEAMEAESERLEKVALEPEPAAAEERGLRPRPDVRPDG
jgi:signal transduction histidine kinase